MKSFTLSANKNKFIAILFYFLIFAIFFASAILFLKVKVQDIDAKLAFMSLLFSFVLTFVFYKFVHLKSIFTLALNIWGSRRLIFSLASNDIKNKYSGSYFGIVWAFIQPIMTILVFWFVFQVGFKSAPVSGVPFILWLIAGFIPWIFFSDAWATGTMAFIEYSYLVKKVVFQISILPIVKILSSLFVHIFFVIFAIGVFMIYGYMPNVFYIQIIYYMFCAVALVTALSFITSIIIIFFRDFSQIISIILQFGMWLTPILWAVDMVPPSFRFIFKLNPLYYIVFGYRDSLINNTWFFYNVKQTIYFWVLVSVLFLIGAVLFKKLKPHFADVL